MIKKMLLATCLFIVQISAATAATTGEDGHLMQRMVTVHETEQDPPAPDTYAEDTWPAEEAEQPVEEQPWELPLEEAADEGEADKPAEERRIGIVTLQSGNLNVRSGPSLDDDIIGKLPNGSVVTVLEDLGEWVSIPHDGSVAYVSRPYLRFKNVSDNVGGKVIVLDPGHGGRDPGAVLKDGTREIDIVWDYTIKAKAALEEAGYVVHLTRDKDRSCVEYKRNQEDLACRAEFAGKVGGDIFISIHADANPVKSFRGTVTFYNARSDYDGVQNPFPEASKRLAQLVQSHVQPAMGSRDRGTENKNYYVNRMNTVPSVLLELAVLTNNNDLKLLKNSKRQDAVAAALVKAIDLYFQTVDDR